MYFPSFSCCFHGVSAFPTAGHPLTPVPAALNVFKLKNSQAISELKNSKCYATDVQLHDLRANIMTIKVDMIDKFDALDVARLEVLDAESARQVAKELKDQNDLKELKNLNNTVKVRPRTPLCGILYGWVCGGAGHAASTQKH
jgi:hypothetical protein